MLRRPGRKVGARPLRIGTRGSALARAQAAGVAEAVDDPTEIVVLSTAGDRGEQVEDKRRWVQEIEQALSGGEIDLAVHSAKDVPAEIASGLVLLDPPAREDARDVLCGVDALSALPAGARVGTSSVRRTAQLRALREDLEIAELRGNVDTRLRRLGEGAFAAIVLAAAGLRRLALGVERQTALDPRVIVPAAGQGVLALEARASDERTRTACAPLADPLAGVALRTERAAVAALGASCHTPVGVHLHEGVLHGFVGLPDGSAWTRDALRGEPGEALGRALAARLLSAGAGELLSAAEAMAGG